MQKPSKISLWRKLISVFSNSQSFSREDLAIALQDKSGNGANFADNERQILQNVLKLSDKRIEDVMVPRADIEAVEESETIASLIALFRTAAHSRLPVYDDNLDNMLGFIHIKDALLHLTKFSENGNGNSIKLLSSVLKQNIGNKGMVRKLLFVPPSMSVGDLLQKMQATRVHMAMVVDEYGGIDGLVTIEDLLETLVGEIEDEHDDDDDELVIKKSENVYIADARAELEELKQILGDDFNIDSYVKDTDTLGGLIFDLIDRVPVVGEVITKFKGFEFEILQADPRRIKKVCIQVKKKAPIRSKKAQKGKAK